MELKLILNNLMITGLKAASVCLLNAGCYPVTAYIVC